jgi:hypothetical protein
LLHTYGLLGPSVMKSRSMYLIDARFHYARGMLVMKSL